MLKVPSKGEARRALASLGSRCLAPIEKQREGALWSKGKLDDESDDVCHDVSVLQRYFESLESRIAGHSMVEGDAELEPVEPAPVKSDCACHKDD